MAESGSGPEYDESNDQVCVGAKPVMKVETTFKEQSGASQPFGWARGHALEEPYDSIIGFLIIN